MKGAGSPVEVAMGFLRPTMPQVDMATWPERSRLEKVRTLAPFWVDNGFGTQRVVHVAYAVKCIGYVAVGVALAWLTTPGLGGLGEIGRWWSEPIFFQKAVVATLLFEVLGLGCGSGPLTLRINPPIGGPLYWLRPGTVRLPPWPSRVPFTAGSARTIVDVVLYAAVLLACGWILLAPGNGPVSTPLLSTDVGVVDPVRLVPLVVLLPLLGLRDQTIFLATRPEHYFLAVLLFFLPPEQMIAAAQLGMLLLWWGAATSKLNHHFPFVVSVMISNAPLHMSSTLKRRLYRRFPDDLRPSRLSTLLARGGTATEFVVPLVLVTATNSTVLTIAVVAMVLFHLHILSTFPMGVPLEWNIFMIFSTLFLFGVHGEIGPAQLQSPWAIALLLGVAAVVVLGNLFPDRFSFLLSMRYYAGNWATSYWCFRAGAVERFDRDIKKVAPAVRSQLATLYSEAEAGLVLDVGQAWRSMHHHGRALNALLPRAVDDLANYDVQEGETVAGVVLGWNFGEGHLHDEQLLEAVQERCGYADGELRVVMLESQPIHRQTQRYRIVDAATGLVESGWIAVVDMVRSQPWLDDAGIPVHIDGPAAVPPTPRVAPAEGATVIDEPTAPAVDTPAAPAGPVTPA
jgi:hypothetical protein